MQTRSGRSSSTTETASRPSVASPTTTMSGSDSRISLKPMRTSWWSSTSTTRICSDTWPPLAPAGAVSFS
ncbi:hypothetical protein ACFPRL_22185 [Pseudoclavibacter helvolus]